MPEPTNTPQPTPPPAAAPPAPPPVATGEPTAPRPGLIRHFNLPAELATQVFGEAPALSEEPTDPPPPTDPDAPPIDPDAPPIDPDAPPIDPDAPPAAIDPNAKPTAPKHWPPEMQTEFDERIGKIWGQRKTAERERDEARELAAELEEKLTNTSPFTLQPTPQDPLAGVSDAAALREAVTQAKTMKRWCRANRDGVILNEGKENEQRISSEEVQEWLDNAEDILTEHVPRKEVQLQERARNDAAARKEFAALFDKNTIEYHMKQAILADMPALANHPGVNMFLGDYFVGLNARLGKPKGKAPPANGNPTPSNEDLPEALRRMHPPISPDTPNPPSRLPKRDTVKDATANYIKQGGGRENMVNIVAAMRDKNSRKDPKAPVQV